MVCSLCQARRIAEVDATVEQMARFHHPAVRAQLVALAQAKHVDFDHMPSVMRGVDSLTPGSPA